MQKIDLDKIEAGIDFLQKKNVELFKKLSRFGVWVLVSGIIFSLIVSAIMGVYAVLGFERTLLIVLLLIFFSNVKQQFQRA